jgi:hypothetical protein
MNSIFIFLKSIIKAFSKPAQFFEEANGQFSGTRLMAFECVNVGLYLALTTPMKDLNVGLIFGLVTLGLTGKLVQKPMEDKPMENKQ